MKNGREPAVSFEMELALLRRLDPKTACPAAQQQYPAVVSAPAPRLSEFQAAAGWKRMRVSAADGEKRKWAPPPLPNPSLTGSFWALEDPPEMYEDDEDDDDDEDGGCSGEQEGAADPVEVLGGVLCQYIFSLLDHRSLGTCLAVSPAWNECLQQNYLWERVCEEVWKGREHNVSSALLHPAIPRLRAFQISMTDAQRVRIEPKDLCRWVWELRCKETIREYWRRRDPHYYGLPPMRRIFHEDGHITAEPMDQIWGGHECSWTIRRLKSNRCATVVRVNHWPLLVVSRTPDWGWRLENKWVVYNSTNISRF